MPGDMSKYPAQYATPLLVREVPVSIRHVLDTPALLVDMDIARRNIAFMQRKADAAGVRLRPHTKTHRTPALAAMQVAAGAQGITVAKIGEAEVMRDYGLDDIFIATVVMGEEKIRRLRALAARARISIGVDQEEQIAALSGAFAGEAAPLDVLLEIETGEARTGVLPGPDAARLAHCVQSAPGLRLAGVFSHEGHCYGAPTAEACREMALESQRATMKAADLIRRSGMPADVVSIGATPSLLLAEILPGITEIRPGTYILMDAAQGAAVGSYAHCAATVLATVTSKPAPGRVILDTGVKALTAFTRPPGGICATPGHGIIKDLLPDIVRVNKLYDEHGIINDASAWEQLALGDRVQVIPNHICPACNLYDEMHVMEQGVCVAVYPILCRGKSQ